MMRLVGSDSGSTGLGALDRPCWISRDPLAIVSPAIELADSSPIAIDRVWLQLAVVVMVRMFAGAAPQMNQPGCDVIILQICQVFPGESKQVGDGVPKPAEGGFRAPIGLLIKQKLFVEFWSKRSRRSYRLYLRLLVKQKVVQVIFSAHRSNFISKKRVKGFEPSTFCLGSAPVGKVDWKVGLLAPFPQ